MLQRYLSPLICVYIGRVYERIVLLSIFLAAHISTFSQVSDTLPGATAGANLLQEVIVSASRVAEKQLTAPVSVSKLTASQLQQSASPSFFEATGNLKGVQLIVPGMGFKVLNTRGFSNTTNVRFVQLIDNIDNQSPHIGAPIANTLSPGNLDIAYVEIVQGAASALYGMNAINGLANFTTKDPFTTQGFSIQQQVGVNHVNDPGGVSARLYNETGFRWARVIAKKWALKINAGFNRGYDWMANNVGDLNAAANLTTNLSGADNPGYDPVNGYGNESSNRRTITLEGKNYIVARTGYAEKDVSDYRLQNWKGDFSVYFKPNASTILSYTGRAALVNSIYQRANRFRLENYLLQQHILQFKSDLVQANAYINRENTGNSYNLRSMAENIDISFKNNNQWYADYSTAFNNARVPGNSVAAAHHEARQSADLGRLTPATNEFNNKLRQLQQINNWDYGAALKVKADMVHSDVSIDFGKLLRTNFTLRFGGDFRSYLITPDGNYFINPTGSGHKLIYTSYGLFVHASKTFFRDKFKLSIALRANDYQYLKLRLNPRLTAGYAPSKFHFIRFSYQTGYRFPSIFEGFSNINSGGVKRVGGLRIMSDGIFENSWLKSSIDSFQSAVNRDVNTQSLTQAEAIDKNKNILLRNSYTYLQPEQMHSFEVGYRSALPGDRLFIDGGIYLNLYSNFIAQIEASIPNTDDVARQPAYLFDRNKQSRYRLWTNSKTLARNYGAELDLRYIMSKHFSLSANGSYQTLQRSDLNDGLEDGFNTPKWMMNTSLVGTNVYKNLGFNVTFKYQSGYYWQSFLVNGHVPRLFNADCMIRCIFSKTAVEVKAGATNVLNRYYYSILGGPQIGGFYYTVVTIPFK